MFFILRVTGNLLLCKIHILVVSYIILNVNDRDKLLRAKSSVPSSEYTGVVYYQQVISIIVITYLFVRHYLLCEYINLLYYKCYFFI